MGKKRDQLLAKVEATIQDHGLIPAGAHVLAAVSGGADSVALARALAALREKHGWRLTLCYVHHRQRAAADEEAAFVEALAGELGVGFELRYLPTDFRERHRTGSLEADMREARYRALAEAAQARGAAVITTGHHRDDLAETVLWNFLRGSGTEGLRGFGARAELFGATVRRPLIACERVEIREWLREQGAAWREDESNADVSRPRNRLRQELMPLIREHLQPNIGEVLARTADIAGADAALLETLAGNVFRMTCRRIDDGLWRIDLIELAAEPQALQRRVARTVIRRLCEAALSAEPESGVSLAFADWLKAGRAGSLFRQLGGVVGYRDYDQAYVMRSKLARRARQEELMGEVRERLWASGELRAMMPMVVKPESARCEISVEKLKVDGGLEVEWNEMRWVFGWGRARDMKSQMQYQIHVPISMLGRRLELRFRKDGDRMVRDDGSLGKKVKEALIDNKVPLVARDWLPVLANERGVIWMPQVEERGWLKKDIKDGRDSKGNTLMTNEPPQKGREIKNEFLCVLCASARE